MDQFSIKITTKNGRTYRIENVKYPTFRDFATQINMGGFMIFNDIMISSTDVEAIEVIL